MPEELKVVIPPNTGVRPREPQPGDYMAEGDTGIAYVVNEESGDYTQFTFPDTDGDYQHSVYFDGQTCTDFGVCHSAEIQLNRHLYLGNFTPLEVQKLTSAGFIVNGKFTRLSKRFSAIKSGTNGGQIPNQPRGNYAYKPWDTMRNIGAVPDALCPYPRLQRTPVFTVENFFDKSSITDDAEAAAKVFLEVVETKYEIVPTTQAMLQKHLKQAPLTIIAGVCRPWDGSVIPACDIAGGHQTALYGFQTGVLWKDVDSYQPAYKRLAWDYLISYAIKGVLTPRSKVAAIPLPPKFTYHWTRNMDFGMSGPDIKALQDFLKLNGCFPTNVSSTGNYGNVTAGAVLKFQIKYNVAPISVLVANKGRYVRALTLPVLNKLAQ